MTRRKPVDSVMKALAWAAVLLLGASGSANAQTSPRFDGGPSAAVVDGGSSAVNGGSSAPTAEKAEPAQQPPTPDTRPDGFAVGGFVFKPGGRIKLDIIRDFNPIGSEDSFDPRTIAVDGSEGTNSNIHARESRLFLDIRGPVEGKELRMYVETDFYGSGNSLRLRHAYGSYGGLLAGQTWSTFVDENNMPNTIDFESPMAFPSIRQAQVRWTQKLSEKLTWAAGVEDNKSAIQTPSGVPGKAEYSMPDLATRFRYEGSKGHVFASAFLGRASFRPTEGEPDNVTLWGTNVSARLKTSARDYAYTQMTFGDGVGRYRGGTTAVPDENGRLQPVGIVALMGGYEHYWSPKYSSNVVYSGASVPSEPYYAADLSEQVNYFALNLLYWFIPARAWAGVEYLYGAREVFGGQEGNANRIQFAVRFNLP